MKNEIITEIGEKIHKLRSVIIMNNYSDSRNLDILVQNLILVQRMLIKNDKVKNGTKCLSLLEKEAEYFLLKYKDELQAV